MLWGSSSDINSANAQKGLSRFPILRNIWDVLKGTIPEGTFSFSDTPPEYPAHWKEVRHNYYHRDEQKQADIQLIEAKNPSRIILYALGFNSSPEDKKHVIESFSDYDATVFVLPLIKAGKAIGTMDENIERIGSLAFHKKSILHQYNEENLPVHIVTHSAGSNAYMHAVHRKSKMLDEVDTIAGVYHTAAFVDAANASLHHHPFKSLFYTFYHAARHKDEFVGTALGDRIYYILNGLTERFLSEKPETRPTHGQNLELIEYGRSLEIVTKEMNEQDFFYKIPPETFYYSSDDDFSCHKAIIDLAKDRNVPENRIVSVDGAHSILDRKENIDLLMKHIFANEFDYMHQLDRKVSRSNTNLRPNVPPLREFSEHSSIFSGIPQQQYQSGESETNDEEPSIFHSPQQS